ncbi:hypothetical protein UFOVP723_125 [uncultured Caudovirales phage]|uniref:Uncharacterized protein n=1 Tax=uncultured Caudovirales phage TaxID=2100421 RepID=A0A6J5NLM1_9CAUD|nr:hypothetical protein UFOVP723_125 [uncultured Caudovirales phage]
MLAHADVKREHMKKLALVLVLGSLASCNFKEAHKPDPMLTLQSNSNSGTELNFITVKISGHDYIVMDGYKSGGICHAESCSCKSK